MTQYHRAAWLKGRLADPEPFRGHVQIRKHVGAEAAQTGLCVYQQMDAPEPKDQHAEA